MNNTGVSLSALRCLRVLRPLRTINKKGLYAVVQEARAKGSKI